MGACSRGASGLAERLARDVQALVSRHTGLRVTTLTDGAPELHALLDEALAAHAPAANEVAGKVSKDSFPPLRVV